MGLNHRRQVIALNNFRGLNVDDYVVVAHLILTLIAAWLSCVGDA
jgi:hypothetical protein